MFEIVLLGLSLALGEDSSVRLALRTGGIPLIPLEPVWTLTS